MTRSAMLSDKNYRSYTSDLNFTRQVWHRHKNSTSETIEVEVRVILDPDSGMGATKTRSHERKPLAFPGLGSRLSLHSLPIDGEHRKINHRSGLRQRKHREFSGFPLCLLWLIRSVISVVNPVCRVKRRSRGQGSDCER
jgi:hypothetical protein